MLREGGFAAEAMHILWLTGTISPFMRENLPPSAIWFLTWIRLSTNVDFAMSSQARTLTYSQISRLLISKGMAKRRKMPYSTSHGCICRAFLPYVFASVRSVRFFV